MKTPKSSDVRKGIADLWETLQCPICLDLMAVPVSTKCDHKFCKFCMTKLLDSSKQNGASCPVCKSKITRRSLRESPSFQKLVTGLQDIIQAYERDTGTNYFTGLINQKKPSSLSGETPDVENADQDISHSHSSTIAAQSDFAKLMGLEDSAPLGTEHECVDSGLGDAPPTSDRKLSSPTHSCEPTVTVRKVGLTHKTRKRKKSSNLTKASSDPESTQDEPLRKSSRKKKRKDLEPDQILEEKKKKSLEKVAEWLLKVPVDEERPPEEAEDSDSASSASTIDLKAHNSDLNAKREDRAKALEDQVFGAVYRRRGTRSTSPLRKDFEELDDSRPEQQGGLKKIKEKQAAEEMTVFKRGEEMEVVEENGLNLSADELEKEEGKWEVPHSSPDAMQQKDEKTQRRSRSPLQDVDLDLKVQLQGQSEVHEQKTTDGRKERNARLKKGQPTKVPPLVLVAAHNGGSSIPKTGERSEEVQVQIENYPSSEDQETPIRRRSSRKSKRLQLSSKKFLNKKVNFKICFPDKGTKMPVDSLKSENATQRNGCVYQQELGGIESMDSGDKISFLKTAEEPQLLSEADASVVSNSISPSAVDPALPEENPKRGPPVGEPQMENEEKNDSELDTEQLLRSFKSAKRKSFHLGPPSMKKNRSDKEEETSMDGKEARCGDSDLSQQQKPETEKSSCSDLIPPSVSPFQTRRTAIEKQDQVVQASITDDLPSDQEAFARKSTLKSSQSSNLSPNEVSKWDKESSPLSVVPQVGESGLIFRAVQRQETQLPLTADGHSSDASKVPETRNESPESYLPGTCRSNAAKHAFLPEYSLTPDGLVEHETSVDASGDISAHSSVNTKPKKKRAQRLESSSESNGSGAEAELPTLKEIFGNAAGNQREAEGCEEAEGPAVEAAEPCAEPCPSPDSQASVDLFGTPEECEVPVNDTSVSIESSQFSSEILVTQQKIEMQKELVRLEKLMALVSEVLQEKEENPAQNLPPDSRQINKVTSPDADPSLRNDQDPVQGSDRMDIPGGAEDLKRVSSEEKVAIEVAVSSHGDATEMATRTAQKSILPPHGQDDKENTSPPKAGAKGKPVFVSSGLGPTEQIMVKKFAKRIGARVVSRVTSEVTHVVMRTDDQLVCERTLKYFLGIAGRKWVVSFQWISESLKQKNLLDESLFEVRGDVVNGPNHCGPQRGRTAEDHNLLLKGFKICFQGSFTDMTTDEMELMVELCGATVVKDPLFFDSKQPHQLVIVQPRSDASSSTYSSLARKATVVTRGWLLDTVATYTVQNYKNYTIYGRENPSISS
ncbi:breast cancer type 1 susceptibility protein [Oryzias latipes]|uniref:RING-type E3 ubiquitin transferase BRCA1 n=2 Tax=Oryzias latipes TaxID=8090 RepID=H2LIE0_ORYLA|nr:breast cancer type 1 susceptibility protein [Oryzias latipes]